MSEQLGPLTAAAVVYLVAGVFCLAHLLRAGTSIRQLLELPRKYVFGCGFLFVLCMVLLFLAVGQARDREQVLEIGLINYLWPASTILLSLLLLKKRASLWLIPGLVSCAYLKVAPGYRLWVGCVVMVIGSLVSWRSLSD